MTREQERARARRRYERRQAHFARKKAVAERNKRVAAVAGVLVLVVAVVVGLSMTARGNHATATSSPSPSPSTSRASAAMLAAGCTTPPPTPQAVPKVSPPDFANVPKKTYTAVVATTCGDITLELDRVKAPQAVDSFVHLAESSYFARSPCHRLTTKGIYVLQCGDPTGTGSGTPGYGFPVENAPKGGTYPRATLAMARTNDPVKGNGSQFFLVYKQSALPTDTGGYSIFGKVTGGMDIVDKIAAAGVAGGAGDGAPAAPISILKVAVTEKKA